MKKMRFLIIVFLINLIGPGVPVRAQNRESQTSTESTVNKKPDNIVGWAIGGTAVVALGIILVMMVRDRRKTIGGMLDQSKPSPNIVTTQSIDNPGSGV